MLFNTLLYAKFFAVVFGISWLLVRPRAALFLPWFLLAGCTAADPTLGRAAVVAVTFAGTFWLFRQRPPGSEADVDRAAVSLGQAVGAYGLSAPFVAYLATRASGAGLASPTLDSVRQYASSTPWIFTLAAFAGSALLVVLMTARRVRLLFVLGASYFFYAHWDYRFLPLIWASSTLDWLLGNAIHRASSARRRKLWLTGTVVLNLGVLAIFKYLNFGVDTARLVLQELGFTPPKLALEIALPVGISFFTFESMSYVIDIYRKKLAPHPSYVEYLSFVAFFPHLVAGPIVRPRDLLPQLAGPPRFSSQVGSEALFLIAAGLFKKVAISDYLALNLVDRVFDAPAHYSALECYAAVVGYAVQIYCDFSGYTDIAIGCALLLGVRFPPNFDSPYKARNLVDFWRRWHISLSTWLRDYLYIPLGGNRHGALLTYRNMLLTMLLGGLWHGANLTFVAWGGIHGVGLALTRALQEFRERRALTARALVAEGGRLITGKFAERTSPSSLQALSVLATFHVVCAAWIFFRAPTFHDAWNVYRGLSTLTTHHSNLPWPVLLVLAVGLLSHWAPERLYRGALHRFQTLPAVAQGVLLFAAAWVIRQMSSADAVPFVYFQF